MIIFDLLFMPSVVCLLHRIKWPSLLFLQITWMKLLSHVGSKASATVQPYLLLHLDIHPESVHTIEDALHLFSAPEALEGYKASAGKVSNLSSCSNTYIRK